MVGIKKLPRKKSIRDIARKRRADLVKQFTKKLLEKFGKYVKCVVLVGSVARDEFKSGSDIDIFLVVDDTRGDMTPEIKQRMDDDIDAIARSLSKDMIIQPAYTLTEFWDMVRISHPLIYNFVRDGIPVYDTGLFMPVKRLLEMGRIPATKEATDFLMDKAPKRLTRVKEVKLFMIAEDCYYSMVDTTQAVLMSLGFPPPSPGEAAREFKKNLVDAGLVDEKYSKWLEEINEFRKKVERKEIKDVSGETLDAWISKTDEFVEKMRSIMGNLDVKKRERIVEKTYDVMSKAIVAALKSLKKLPDKPDEISDAFKKNIVDAGIVDAEYGELFKKLEGMAKLVREGKILEIPEKEVYANREYVRKFIHQIGKILKDAPDA